MTGERTLTDGVILLRAIERGDISRLFEWRNDPRTRPMFRDDAPLDFDAHSRFVRECLASQDCTYWMIIEASRIPVGTISLHHFSADGWECEFGRFIISPEHRGSGYGRRALALLMTLAASLGVHRISCEVRRSNAQALRLYRSLGFRAQGTDDCAPRNFVLMEAELP